MGTFLSYLRRPGGSGQLPTKAGNPTNELENWEDARGMLIILADLGVQKCALNTQIASSLVTAREENSLGGGTLRGNYTSLLFVLAVPTAPEVLPCRSWWITPPALVLTSYLLSQWQRHTFLAWLAATDTTAPPQLFPCLPGHLLTPFFLEVVWQPFVSVNINRNKFWAINYKIWLNK